MASSPQMMIVTTHYVSSTTPCYTMSCIPTVTTDHSTGFISPYTAHSSNLRGGALGGIVVSGVVFVLIMVAVSIVLGYYWHRKKHKKIHKIYASREAKATGISSSTFYTNEYVNPSDEIISVSSLTNDYENIEFEDSIFATVCRPHLKCDYETGLSLNVLSLPREATLRYANYYSHFNTDVEATMELSEASNYEVPIARSTIYKDPGTNEEELYQWFDTIEFQKLSSKDIKVVHKIGSGEFGVVRMGYWSKNSTGPVQVAVKTLNSQCSESDRMKFLREAAIMGQFVHNNVVQLHGVVIEEENMMIVLEYMPKGDLRTFLLRKRSSKQNLSSAELPVMLLNFCGQIAAGMNYLANKQFIHRDLAARNILVSIDGVCKIADFGMARDVTDETYYIATGGKIPVRWTAPEALLYQKYSVSSDIWSYGCVLFEVWSLGCRPFENSSGTEVLDLICTGYRLPPPPGCPRAIYQIMIKCWNVDPRLRPVYSLITDELNRDDVLNWTTEDVKTADGSNARSLGGSLSSGRKLFNDLQSVYCSS